MMQPFSLTEKDRVQIAALMIREGIADHDQKEELIERMESGPCVRFEDYVSDCPGWCGDLYFIVWGEAGLFTYIGRNENEWWVIHNSEA